MVLIPAEKSWPRSSKQPPPPREVKTGFFIIERNEFHRGRDLCEKLDALRAEGWRFISVQRVEEFDGGAMSHYSRFQYEVIAEREEP